MEFDRKLMDEWIQIWSDINAIDEVVALAAKQRALPKDIEEARRCLKESKTITLSNSLITPLEKTLTSANLGSSSPTSGKSYLVTSFCLRRLGTRDT